MALLIMKKLLLILPILLVGCGQSSNQELNFPDSSYGKAMKCANDNYFSFYEKMTGDSSRILENKVGEYCFDVMSEAVDKSLYTGRASLERENDELVLFPNITPNDKSKTLNHLLHKMKFDVYFATDNLGNEKCPTRIKNFYGTYVVELSKDNSFSGEVTLRDSVNQSLSTVLENDGCFAAWWDANVGTSSYQKINNTDKKLWFWSIVNAQGLFFNK